MLIITLQIAVAILIFATGLSATREDYYSVWQQPHLLGRALLALYVLMPALAISMALSFDLPRETQMALLFLSVSAGTPLLPKKVLVFGSGASYAFGLAVATTLAAVVTVPVSLELIQPLLPEGMKVKLWEVVLTILRTLIGPLLAGLLFRTLWPVWADRLGEPLLRGAGMVLGLGAVSIIAVHWRDILTIGLPTLTDFILLVLAGLLVGHWLGGANEQHKTCLAVACSTRHISLALLMAGNVRSATSLALIASYLLASVLVCTPYIKWRRKLALQAASSAAANSPSTKSAPSTRSR